MSIKALREDLQTLPFVSWLILRDLGFFLFGETCFTLDSSSHKLKKPPIIISGRNGALFLPLSDFSFCLTAEKF